MTGYRVLFKTGKQREFINAFMASNHMSQRKASTFIGVPRRSFRNWVYEKHLLPLKVLTRIIQTSPDLSHFLNHVVELRNINWGLVKGGRKCYKLLRKKYGESVLMKRRIAGGRKSIEKKWVKITDNLPHSDNSSVLELLGALIGDGWIGISAGRRQTCFCGNLSQIAYARHLQKLLRKNFGVRGALRLREESSTFYITVNSFPVFDFFRNNFDFPIGYKTRFNTELFPTNWVKSVHILRGIFDTDGGIYFDNGRGYKRPYPVLCITSYNPELLSWMRKVLEENDFKVIRHKQSIRIKTILQVERWFNEVKPSNKFHIQKWNRWKQFYVGP